MLKINNKINCRTKMLLWICTNELLILKKQFKKQIMEKEFIPYEQALALKELGFDEPCFGWYAHNGVYTGYSIKNSTINELNMIKNSCSTPLYQQAFRWFREKYNLDKVIYPTLGSEGNYYINIFKNYNSDNSLYWNCSYETLEEAELECLKKLIEIVKTK
jgi:hypothetical protein